MSDPHESVALGNRAVVITGAGRGVGRALAQAFCLAGARVLLVGRDRARLETTTSLIGERSRHPSRCQILALDVTSCAAAAKIEAAMETHFGAWDTLINSAGVFHYGDFLHMQDAVWQQALDTNLTAPFRLAQALVRKLVAAHLPGCVINIGSIHGQIGDAMAVAQCAAKAGVIGMTKALAEACRGHRIRVNAIAPGAIAPATIADTPADTQPPAVRVAPSDVAQLAVFLASDAASLITGSVLEAFGDTRPVIFTPPATSPRKAIL